MSGTSILDAKKKKEKKRPTHVHLPLPPSPSYFLPRGTSKIKSAVTGCLRLTELWSTHTAGAGLQASRCPSLPQDSLCVCRVKAGQQSPIIFLVCFWRSKVVFYSVGFYCRCRRTEKPTHRKVRDACGLSGFQGRFLSPSFHRFALLK